MDDLNKILEQATAAIEPAYFQLEIDDGDPIYRERVYCYELYHQMRIRWPDNTPYYLNGEIDKAAHPILSKLDADFAKPDLLIHRPGFMEGNHAIIEVKTPRASNDAIQSDLNKLSLFVAKVGYERAIYLVYGFESNETLLRVNEVAKHMGICVPIEVWTHANPGAPAERQRHTPK